LNKSGSSAAAIPGPLSTTLRRTSVSRASAINRTIDPIGENLIALETRLSMIALRSDGSALTARSDDSAMMVMPFSAAIVTALALASRNSAST
jgi:hypothetical protein